MINRDLQRLDGLLTANPETEVWLLSHSLIGAKLFSEQINDNLKTKRKFRVISNHPTALESVNLADSIVLLCGNWWENKNAVDFIKNFSKLVKYALPITYFPPRRLKGGENE